MPRKEEATTEEADAYGENETAEAPKASADDLIRTGKSARGRQRLQDLPSSYQQDRRPCHAEVAKKYDFTKANVNLLADKIINGGSGV